MRHRKKNDTSLGDGFTWKWMIYCAAERKAELVVISRDADYGVSIEKKRHLNDHPRQEFGNFFAPDGTRSQFMEPDTADGPPSPMSHAPY